MSLSSRVGVEADPALQVLWEDGERVVCRGWRQEPDGNRREVLAVLLAAEHPSPTSVARLGHEFSLKDELDAAWAARPLELGRDHGRPVLVLENAGGEPLERMLGAPMEVRRFLRLAIGVATALKEVHNRGLVHKDVKPANILVNCSSGEVRLTGFGIASRLPRERQSPDPPETLAGTLAYMAPEQTGRMNRSIDGRSDLYSLGMTFYHMLVGHLPFTAADAMEWVHCHIARRPAPPAARLPTIPGPISAIVVKLLAKTAEDRYQTARGLECDLQRCLAEWDARGRIDDFPLGQHDTPQRLLIPERLYGREREVATLLDAFDRVVQRGLPELVLVSGYPGIGKSSVVNELHKVLALPRGLFAAGKFDQYKRDIPYSTLAQAFQSLVRSLLGKSEAELSDWRAAILEAVGQNGRLVIDLVPELKLIIGDQPPVLELPPRDAQRRVQRVLRRFIGVFASPEHPLALFLDDLQWLDAATLDLIEDLLNRPDVQRLLLIGAYRDNEVTVAHPLRRRLDAIKAAGGKVTEIKLEPLPQDRLEQLIADALRCEPQHAAQLARLVHEKTGGNPFFTIQFLSSLFEEGMLRFDHRAAQWSWDIKRILAKGYTDNVVEFLIAKLQRLPTATQNALQLLACLGAVAQVATLKLVWNGSDASERAIHSDLWEAVRQDLILRTDGAYRFVHDRVQEAAYSSMPADVRAAAHLRIGRVLAAHMPPEKRAEKIFEIVNQLNRGAELIPSQEERESLAELNLIAGQRAKASAAYASALTYLTVGAELRPEDCWERRHDFAFALDRHRAECEFLTGATSEAETRLAALAARAADTVEQATVACLRMDLYTTRDHADCAIAVGLDYLSRLGVDWSAHATQAQAREEYARIWSQLGQRSIEDLIDLPLMTDPSSLATLDVLTRLVAPAMLVDSNLTSLAICRAANLSLERGNHDGSPFAYVMLGMVARAHFGDTQAGRRFGQLGYDLLERRGLKRFQARTYMNLGNTVLIWARHARAVRDFTHRAFEIANEVGDLTYATYSRFHLNTNMLAAGDPLVEAQREAAFGLAFAQKARFGLVADIVATQLALVRTLRGMTTRFGRLDYEDFNERRIEQRFQENPTLARAECCYHIRKLQARFFAGDYAGAVEAATKAQALLWTSHFLFEAAEYHFYSALAIAGTCDVAGGEEREPRLAALASHHRQLALWAQDCPENFETRAALVAAEIARIEGRTLDAERLYEQAIRSARANGFVHNEALGYELAARFYTLRGFEEFGQFYLRKARDSYMRWGADAKVRRLHELYPHLTEEESAPGPTSTIGAPLDQLDLATVTKVSQAVSGEIVLENLLDTLMRIAIEQAGAERGLLMISQEAELRIAAEATTRDDTIVVRLGDQPVTSAALPETIVQTVARTHETVILNDAATDPAFASDAFIRQRQSRSVLCLALVTQSKLIGVLYLENSLASGVFTPARISVLRLIASQAAISLENTRLYRDLAEREGRIRRLVDANIIGIFNWRLDGENPEFSDAILSDANDAFRQMVGYERADFEADRVRRWDLTPPEWRLRTQQAHGELMITGTNQPYEKEYVRKDGSRVPVLIGAAAHEGGTQGVAFVVDLTARKQAEHDLRASESRFRTFVDHATDAFFLLDDELNTLDVNSQACESLGYTRDELIGMSARDVDAGLDEASIERLKQRIIAGDTLTLETHYRRKDGALFPVEVMVTRFEQGGRRFLALARDITVRKRAEQRLLAHHDVSRILAEAMTVEEASRKVLEVLCERLGWDVGVLWRIDQEAHVLRCLEFWRADTVDVVQFEATTRAAAFPIRSGLPGRVWATRAPVYVSDVAHDPIFLHADAAVADGLHAVFGFPILLGGEVLGVLDFVSRHMPPPDPDLLDMVATIGSQIGQFIERKRAESALQLAQTDLAHVMRVMTMGELTASIAHEINQPLAALAITSDASLRWLDHEPPNLAEVRSCLHRMGRDSRRAADVVARIRSLVKKAPPVEAKLDLNEAIQEVLAITAPEARRQAVTLRAELSPDLPPVRGDRVQLQQVMLNLVVNGIDAMKEMTDRPREMRIRSTSLPPDSVLVSVEDNGVGLTEANLETIFKGFYTTKAQGMGIGLSISRSIIEAHGGRLWAEMNKPRGAVLRFTIPRHLEG